MRKCQKNMLKTPKHNFLSPSLCPMTFYSVLVQRRTKLKEGTLAHSHMVLPPVNQREVHRGRNKLTQKKHTHAQSMVANVYKWCRKQPTGC